jgi:hypothetical protein
MNNFNYWQLRNLIEDYADIHPVLMGADLGPNDYRGFYNESQSLFPRMYVTVTSISRTRQTTNWNLRVYILDLLLDNRENYDDITNTQFEILNDFYNYIEFIKLPHKSISFNMTPIHNWDRQQMAGWYADIIIEAKSLQCLNFVEIDPEKRYPLQGLVNWVVVDNDGNELASGDQPCGKDLTITVDLDLSTMVDVLDENNNNYGTFSVSGLSDTISIQSLPATYSIIDQLNNNYGSGNLVSGTSSIINITVPQPVGITFKIPIPSAVVSNTPNKDAGWRYSAPINWFNYNNPQNTKIQTDLDFNHNNPHFNLKNDVSFRGFSSKKRFVDIKGGQNFTTYPDVFIDKLTGLTYRRVTPSLADEATSFNDTENFSITTDGITLSNWFVASIEELLIIYGFGKTTANFQITDPDTNAAIHPSTTSVGSGIRTSSATPLGTYLQVLSTSNLNIGTVNNTGSRFYIMVSKELLNQFNDYI